MTQYLLDTNIPLYLGDPDSPFHNFVRENFQKLQDEDRLFISMLSLYELYYGAALKRNETRNVFADQTLMIIEEIQNQFELLPLSGDEAIKFGEIKAHYRARSRKGEKNRETIKKHDVDFILAAAAIEHDLVLVSNDKIFSKIKESFPELQVENWANSDGF